MPDILGVEETLQTFSSSQTIQDVFFLFSTETGLAADAFQLLLPPALLVLVGGVHVFSTDGAAIRFAQRIQQFAQGHGVPTKESVAGVEHGFQIGIGQTVERQFQLWNVIAFFALEGIQISPARTHVAVGRNQLLGVNTLAPHFGVWIRQNHTGRPLLGTFRKRIDDRQMGHITRICSIASRHMLKRVEIAAPCIRDTAGIGQIVFVHLFDIRSVAAEKVRTALVGTVNVVSLTHCFADLGFPLGNISWLIKPSATRLNRWADATVTGRAKLCSMRLSHQDVAKRVGTCPKMEQKDKRADGVAQRQLVSKMSA